jgi:hypothetical protein
MRGWMMGVIGVCLLMPVPALAREPARSTGWILDYKEARALARRTGKPMLVVFR